MLSKVGLVYGRFEICWARCSWLRSNTFLNMLSKVLMIWENWVRCNWLRSNVFLICWVKCGWYGRIEVCWARCSWLRSYVFLVCWVKYGWYGRIEVCWARCSWLRNNVFFDMLSKVWGWYGRIEVCWASVNDKGVVYFEHAKCGLYGRIE